MRLSVRKVCLLSACSTLICILFLVASLSDNLQRVRDTRFDTEPTYLDNTAALRHHPHHPGVPRKLYDKKKSDSPSNDGAEPRPSNDERIAAPAPLNYEHDVLLVPSTAQDTLALTQRRADKALASALQAYLNRYQMEFGNQPECNRSSDMLLGQFLSKKLRKIWSNKDPWEKFYNQIGKCDLYRENSNAVEQLLKAISTMPIKAVENMSGGTQVKFIITYENGQRALFKPMRFSREYETHPNHFYFSDFERHTAEIGAYHLDKVLGFRRVPPVVGRTVDIDADLWQKAEKSLAKTFFYSPAKNLCFVSKCDYYCDTSHAVCGHPDKVEGSFQVFLPDDELVPREHVRSPYKRTYSKKTQLAVWQTDNSYCERVVKNRASFKSGRRLLDLVDLSILDTLMGNLDRHHYETLTVFEEIVYPLHLDNGRGFGKAREDYNDCLAPLYQCCVIRPSTFETLLRFYSGPVSLTTALKESMSKDPAYPILADKHFVAIERRLEFILHKLKECLDRDPDKYAEVIRTSFYNPNGNTEEEEEEDES